MADQADSQGLVPEFESSGVAAGPIALWCIIALLVAVGCLGIYRELLTLWIFWTSDPLRSIGMLIPPFSVVLTLRVWRQYDWEKRGTWWGILVIALAYFLSWLRLNTMLLGMVGNAAVSLIPLSLPEYVYGSGVVLLFAGPRVWRKAWFPLGLLLLCQPVPVIISDELIDVPLQNISARVARSFATLIGFAPTTPQLRLMFSPDFGMFIAPGCDGIRGAVTMGYVALVLGYLKRVSILRWITYVSGAVLLGYLFNFIRLCLLVLYYRVALGHPTLEGLAKQADYLIGSSLFLIATLLFLWLSRRSEQKPAEKEPEAGLAGVPLRTRNLIIKSAAFAAIVVAALALSSSALTYRLNATPSPQLLAARMPKQVGNFALTRTWFEQQSGTILVESGAYSAPESDEIILGVWVAPLIHFHDPQQCWLARGLQPEALTASKFAIAGGESVPLRRGFYDDGITNSIVISGTCTPSSCTQFQQVGQGRRIGFLFLKLQSDELSANSAHPVSIMLRIDRLHTNSSRTETYSQLSDEAQTFLAGLDMKGLSRAFQ